MFSRISFTYWESHPDSRLYNMVQFQLPVTFLGQLLMFIQIILLSLQIHLPITTLIFGWAQLWISFCGYGLFLRG